jgi:hypothetical protein
MTFGMGMTMHKKTILLTPAIWFTLSFSQRRENDITFSSFEHAKETHQSFSNDAPLS